METSNFRTFKARAFDETPLGEVFCGTVKITIDFGDLNERSLSSKFVLRDIIEVDELPTFNIFDFPEVDIPMIDLQSNSPSICIQQASSESVLIESDNALDSSQAAAASSSSLPHSVSCNVPLDMIDNVTMEAEETNEFPDYQMLIQTFDPDEALEIDEFQQDNLLQDVDEYENTFVPIHHPVSRAGVQVNRRGEIILYSDDEEAMKTLRIRQMDQSFIKIPKRNNNLQLVSKENKKKLGPVYAFDVYRNGTWLKVCDLHLPSEIIKTFQPLF